MSESNTAYLIESQKKVMRTDRELAGSSYPTCHCFNSDDQIVSLALAKILTSHYSVTRDPNQSDEVVLREMEDKMALWTAEIASMLPKLVANHVVISREVASTLSMLAVSAVRREAP